MLKSEKIKKLIFLFTMLFAFCDATQAQKVKITSGKSQIKVESNLSRDEALEKAIELAKIDAIVNAFGEYIEQESVLEVKSGKVDFRTYGQTKVKGEWIRSISPPKVTYNERINNGIPETWITCEVNGETRRVTPKANLEVEVLSCPNKNCRTSEFFNNQDAFLYVRSSVDGYLSVFLDDGHAVFRLFPYIKMKSQKAIKISGDQDYILFSRDHNNFEVSPDRIELTTSNEQEINTFIVVFSETEFQKPLLFDAQKDNLGYTTPKSLSRSNFERWLGDNRATISDFLDLKKRITIKTE